MKKITATAFLFAALVSCKKETVKTENTAASTNGQNPTTATVKDSVQAEEIKPALADSAGVYRLRFKLEKGKTYPFVTYQKDSKTLTDPSGKSVSGTDESVDEMSFTVTDVKDGVYTLDVKLISKKNSTTSEGKTITIDTRGKEPTDDNLKLFWNVNKALMGNTLQMKMDRSGKILSVSGFDPIYKKIGSTLAPIIKDAKERDAIAQGFKQSFNEKVLKDQLRKSLTVIPAKGVKLGESWTETSNISPDGKVKNSTTFTLSKVGDDIAEVTVKGGVPRTGDKKSQNGVTHSISIEGSQSGVLKVDVNSGWIRSSELKMNTTQKETLSDGKQSQTMTQKSNSVIKINP